MVTFLKTSEATEARSRAALWLRQLFLHTPVLVLIGGELLRRWAWGRTGEAAGADGAAAAGAAEAVADDAQLHLRGPLPG